MRTGTLLQNLALLIGLEVFSAVVQFPWLSLFLRVADHLRLAGTSEVIWSKPLPKQGHLELLPRTVSRWLLSISKDGDSTASLGSLLQCSVILTVKTFPDVQREPPLFQFVSVASGPVTGHH